MNTIKKYYVTRGGRDMCLTQDYNQALLIAKNKPERVQEFSNYHMALRLLARIVNSGIEHSQKPTGDFVHLDVSVNRATGTAEFRVMQGDKHLIAATNIEHCTPNVAEFIALVEAHKYCSHYGITQDIYCDNIAAIKWFKGEMPIIISPTLFVANPKLEKLIDIATDYIYEQKEGYANNVKHWDKSMWGEIPSDYKRKKRYNDKPDTVAPEGDN